MKRLLLLFALVAFCGVKTTRGAEGPGTPVSGNTLTATLEGSECSYKPLPNVKFMVFRGGPVFQGEQSSDDNGFFKFKVPAGPPFQTLFYLDDKTVPQMENLAAQVDLPHNFHVGLLSIQDYQRLEKEKKLPSLVKHLEGILGVVPEGSQPAKLIDAMLKKLR